MLQFGVLGPLEVLDGAGVPLDVGGRQPRILLAVLLVAGRSSVPADTIVDAIWGDGAPASASVLVPPPPAAARRASTLIGREPELSHLVAALDESADDARFVVIEGEPGIGKTRLVDELRQLAETRGALALWGRSDEGGAAPALWPWLAPLRAVVAQAEAVPNALLELLNGEVSTGAGQAQAVQFERFEGVAEVLGRVAGVAGGASEPSVAAVAQMAQLWEETKGRRAQTLPRPQVVPA